MIQNSSRSPGRLLCYGSAPDEKDKMADKLSLMVNSGWQSSLPSSECLEHSGRGLSAQMTSKSKSYENDPSPINSFLPGPLSVCVWGGGDQC